MIMHVGTTATLQQSVSWIKPKQRVDHRHSTSTQNLYGANPHTNNYRITTSATGDGSWEAFDRGTIPLVNADVSGIIGSSSGQPYGYYCSSSSFTRYAACADNIAMPNGFNFTYFGTDYSYTDTNDRIHLSRHGNMHFLDTGSTSTVRTMSTWGANMPTLPGPSPATNFARAGMIAPYWSYYGTYYCYQSQTQDCGVYYRTMPFEGKGTDISSGHYHRHHLGYHRQSNSNQPGKRLPLNLRLI